MRIAFVGLGAMGSLMAAQLARQDGIELALFDRDRERLEACAPLGRLAGSVQDAARGADAVFSVVPADRHVEAVTAELLEGAMPGQFYVDFSTTGPDTIERAAERLGAVGVETIGAGMTKSLEGARSGALVLFAGGPAELPDALRPAFDALTSEVRMVGGAGAAKALKLVNNMVVSCLDVVICEALVLGRRLGLGYEDVTAALAAHGADSWPLHHHIVKHVLPDDLGPGFFSTRFLIKDLRLYMAFAESLGLPAVFAGLAGSFYRGTVAHGHGDDYHMVVVRWLEQGANLAAGDHLPTAGLHAVGTPEENAVTIARGVAAVQALVSAEALTALGLMDVDPLPAADHLEAGSAGNDTLRAFTAGRGRLGTAALVADLSAALALAEETFVPATMLEVARHTVLGYTERAGADALLALDSVRSA